MHRRVAAGLGLAGALALAGAGGAARADEADVAADQELGAALGIEAGGRVSPGGLVLGGTYLYRLSDQDWFDGGIEFTFGGGDAACFRERDDSFVCDHGLLDGDAGEISGGVRRFFPGLGQAGFVPYARVGLAARLVHFAGDDVTGFAAPLELGAGVRAAVADRVRVTGGATLRAGPGWFSDRLGAEPYLSLAITGGVDFEL